MITFISVVIFSFISYFWISLEAWKRDSEKIFCKESAILNLHILNYKHLSGIILLAILPLTLLPHTSLSFLNFFIYFNAKNSTSFTFLMILSFLIAAQLAESKKRQLGYVKKQAPTRDLHLVYYLSLRILYLVSYEIFFRGIILFGCAAYLGNLLSVIINTLLSVLMHSYGTRPEIFARIPFGIALCWVSIAFVSVWPAILAHLVLSLVYEIRLYKNYFLSKNQFKQ